VVGYTEGPPAGLPLLQRALAEAGEGTALSAEVHRDMGFVLGVSTERFTAAPVDQFLAAFETATRLGDEGLLSQVLAFEAIAEFVTGHGVRRDLTARALATRHRASRVPMELRPRVIVSHVLRCSDDLAGARELLTGEYAEAIEQGAETDLPFLILHLAELETWAGNYDLAEEYAEHGHQVALAAGAVTPAALMHAVRALIRAVRGPFDEARAEAGLAIDGGLRTGVYYPALLGCHALGLVELASGNPSGAHAILSMVTQATSGREMVDPGWFALRPVPGDIEALIRLGDLAAAEPLLASLEERARALDRAWALATAGRCRALLASAQGDHDAAGAALGQAFAAHERLDMPFELARTHLAAGDVARRARRKVAAREHVESARAAFARLGAEPWAARAAAELARLNASRASRLALTQAESQVASLVAAGHTNREVAAELYMGLRTVEAHLSAVYRKLGIRSRSELARAWAQQASSSG
jgi:DNA-binding CsgD family transcriptional regulator